MCLHGQCQGFLAGHPPPQYFTLGFHLHRYHWHLGSLSLDGKLLCELVAFSATWRPFMWVLCVLRMYQKGLGKLLGPPLGRYPSFKLARLLQQKWQETPAQFTGPFLSGKFNKTFYCQEKLNKHVTLIYFNIIIYIYVFLFLMLYHISLLTSCFMTFGLEPKLWAH